MRFSFTIFRLFVPRVFVIFFRYAWPWVWWALRMSFYFTVLGLVTLWAGVPTTTRMIANRVTQGAVENGLPHQLARILYYVICVISVIEIVIGWIILAFVVVGLIDFVF